MKELLSFFFVGLLNTLLCYGFFAFWIYLGLPYPLALLLSYLLGVFFSYINLQKRVFKSKPPFAFLRFITSGLFLYAFNVIFVRWINLRVNSLYLAGFFSLTFVSLLSFFLNKWFVFRSPVSKKAKPFG